MDEYISGYFWHSVLCYRFYLLFFCRIFASRVKRRACARVDTR